MLAVLVMIVASISAETHVISAESHVVWTAFVQVCSGCSMPTIGRHSIGVCQTAVGLHILGIRGVQTHAPERCSCLKASACDNVEDAWRQLHLMHDGSHFKAG